MRSEVRNTNGEKQSRVIGIDLFCGAGGITRGLSDAGIDVRYGVDINEDFRATYEKNNSPSKFYQIDVRHLCGRAIEQLINLQPDEQFMLAACAPCQPFSRHNRDHSYDRRKSLLLQVGRILKELPRKPDFLLIENVPAINDIGKRIVKNFENILDELRYNYVSDVIDAKDYGVPQRRKRFILIGVKKAQHSTPLDFPEKTHGNGRGELPAYRTVESAISHFPKLKAGKKHCLVLNHECAGLSPINLQRLKASRPGGSRQDWPEDLILNCHKNYRGHGDVYGRMKWDAPAPTLTCRCTSISNGRFGHPSQLRAISVREAAALQTFPDNYEFIGDLGSKSMQVGNAVPVLLAKIFGEHLLSLVNNKVTKSQTGKKGNVYELNQRV